MSSQQIQALITPPNNEEAHQRTITLLNSSLHSLNDLDDVESFVLKAKQHHDELQANVRPYESCFPTGAHHAGLV